jgi:AcrR family transcriptional regulator
MANFKDLRLKAFVQNQMKELLLKAGRQLVSEEGVEALSARKLALKANSSVGVIYNIFGTMDNYVTEQNILTLTDLFNLMNGVVLSTSPFNNLNRYAEVLTAYIEANPNLWYLLYQRHLCTNAPVSSIAEARVIKKIDVLIGMQALRLIGNMEAKEKRLAVKVLEMSLFALSGYLLGNKLHKSSGINRNSLCQLLMNTYMAGLMSLKGQK